MCRQFLVQAIEEQIQRAVLDRQGIIGAADMHAYGVSGKSGGTFPDDCFHLWNGAEHFVQQRFGISVERQIGCHIDIPFLYPIFEIETLRAERVYLMLVQA